MLFQCVTSVFCHWTADRSVCVCFGAYECMQADVIDSPLPFLEVTALLDDISYLLLDSGLSGIDGAV